MTTLRARAYVQRDALRDGEAIPFVAATEGQKADGLDLRMDRVLLDRFHSNPVIGYGHDYWGRESLPIGRSVETTVDGPRLRMAVEFDAGDPFAVDVDRKVRAGYLNAMSIGFDVGRIDADGVPDWWELFESSVVPLPMDPDATAERMARMLAGVRDGKVLSSSNSEAISAAIAALQTVLDGADLGRQPDHDPSPRPAPDDRRRRLQAARART